jgi:hypothetical protein
VSKASYIDTSLDSLEVTIKNSSINLYLVLNIIQEFLDKKDIILNNLLFYLLSSSSSISSKSLIERVWTLKLKYKRVNKI